MVKKHYIYKFIDQEENVLYVGKTRNLDQRLRSHIKDREWIEVGINLYCAEVDNLTDMDIYETYYINKLKPRYNKLKMYGAEFTQKIDELNFILYKKLKDNDLIFRERNNLDKIVLCGTERDDICEFSGLAICREINIYEAVSWDMNIFLYETNIAEDYVFGYSILNEDERAFVFTFKTHNEKSISIYLMYNPETIIDIPNHVYYDDFLPILQKDIKESSGDYNYLLYLDEILCKGE